MYQTAGENIQKESKDILNYWITKYLLEWLCETAQATGLALQNALERAKDKDMQLLKLCFIVVCFFLLLT